MATLTLRRKDRLELFFEGRGHRQAFDDLLCKVAPGIGYKVIRVFRLRRRTLDPLAFSEAASTARTRSRGTPGGMAQGRA